MLLLVALLIPLMILLAKLHEQENDLLKGIIEKGIYKSLAGCKQFEEIVRKHGGYQKNHGIGYFNANEVEWEEGQYPKPKFFPQREKYVLTSPKGTSSQDDLPPQDHKGKGKLHDDIDTLEDESLAMVKWVPKATPSSTSTSATSTPRIPINLMWVPKKKNQRSS